MKMNFESPDTKPERRDPKAVIAEARGRLMGGDDVESDVLNIIEAEYDSRYITAGEAIRRVESLLEQRQNYH
jgi:hypothetical protein